VYPQIDQLETGARYKEPMLLPPQQPRRHLRRSLPSKRPASHAACNRVAARHSAISSNTGNIDVVVLNVGQLFRLSNGNRSPYHRVLFKLIGTKSNRAAIGARVTIHSGGVKQFSEVRGGASYLSQNDLRLHLAGRRSKMDTVEIRWPNGATETLRNVSPTPSTSGS